MKMDDWEDEPSPLLLGKEQPKCKWDDEDTDENDVKESWEDEYDSTLATTTETPAAKSTKNVLKAVDRKVQTAEVAKGASLDLLTHNLQQQRIAEKGDPKSTEELFPESSSESPDNFIPKSESDFLEEATISLDCSRAVMRLSMVVLKAADAKEIASSVTAVANEKIKAEKEAAGHKSKTGSKKKKLHVDKLEDDAHLNAYDAVDDYDLM